MYHIHLLIYCYAYLCLEVNKFYFFIFIWALWKSIMYLYHQLYWQMKVFSVFVILIRCPISTESCGIWYFTGILYPAWLNVYYNNREKKTSNVSVFIYSIWAIFAIITAARCIANIFDCNLEKIHPAFFSFSLS
jgi:hypothetical protein